MDEFAAYQAVAHSIRDRLLDKWNASQQYFTLQDPKRVYYLSLEFLLGRTLDNAMLNMGVKEKYKSALEKLGFSITDLIGEEVDAALGNGGLGRLAACYLDSLATTDYPAWGYGIRYQYGIFQQRIVDGYQTEFPDYWLNFGNPWEIQRLDVSFEVRFGGHVVQSIDTSGHSKYVWEGCDKVVAVAYDYPIPGFGTNNCINIRLWSSKPKKVSIINNRNSISLLLMKATTTRVSKNKRMLKTSPLFFIQTTISMLEKNCVLNNNTFLYTTLII